MELFKRGGFLYGVYFLIWRGAAALGRIISTQVYKRAIANCGQNNVFGLGAYIYAPNLVSIGSNCQVGDRVTLTTESETGWLTLDDNVQISRDCAIDYSGGIRIKSGSLLSSHVVVYTHDHGYDPRSVPETFPLLIEEDVWIGSHTMIMPTVGTIGKGAIIGSGSLVTKSVPPKTIVAGRPAKVLKSTPHV